MAGRSLVTAEVVDHINFNILDNRRSNLRITTKQGNSQNRMPRNGYRGVTFHKCGKWQAQVGHNGRTHYGGLHDTQEEAAEAAKAIRLKLHFLGETS